MSTGLEGTALFEAAQDRARQARDSAVDRVERGAPDEAKERAVAAVREAARRWPDGFTTDDVLSVAGGVGFREPRAWGAVMRTAQRLGICKPTDRQRQSTSTRCHARPKRVWRAVGELSASSELP